MHVSEPRDKPFVFEWFAGLKKFYHLTVAYLIFNSIFVASLSRIAKGVTLSLILRDKRYDLNVENSWRYSQWKCTLQT